MDDFANLNYTNLLFAIILLGTLLVVLLSTEEIGVIALAHGEPAIQNPTGIIFNPNIVNDSRLKVDLVTNRLTFPTTMDFLGPNDLLVLEKSTGKVMRVSGSILSGPLLDVNVATGQERGMIGIAITKDSADDKLPKYVFLYFTESKLKDGGEAIGNRLYRYELMDDRLTNPKLILDLPVNPGPFHNGGLIKIGPDNNIYVMVGDLFRSETNDSQITKTQNIKNGEEPIGIGGILRLTEQGYPVDNGMLGKEYPLNLYYAYGIRNGFGMDFDPLTGNLWDTENGPNFGDEINLVEPGFNSGWRQVQGIWKVNGSRVVEVVEHNPSNLVNFEGQGKYSPPELSWKRHHGITSLNFYNATTLGLQYKNGLFVGDYHFGNIYHFQLNENRTGLNLNGILADKVADNNKELGEKMFATGFGLGISDIEVGPDGYLYVVAHGQGSIYRVYPETE